MTEERDLSIVFLASGSNEILSTLRRQRKKLLIDAETIREKIRTIG